MSPRSEDTFACVTKVLSQCHWAFHIFYEPSCLSLPLNALDNTSKSAWKPPRVLKYFDISIRHNRRSSWISTSSFAMAWNLIRNLFFLFYSLLRSETMTPMRTIPQKITSRRQKSSATRGKPTSHVAHRASKSRRVPRRKHLVRRCPHNRLIRGHSMYARKKRDFHCLHCVTGHGRCSTGRLHQFACTIGQDGCCSTNWKEAMSLAVSLMSIGRHSSALSFWSCCRGLLRSSSRWRRSTRKGSCPTETCSLDGTLFLGMERRCWNVRGQKEVSSWNEVEC